MKAPVDPLEIHRAAKVDLAFPCTSKLDKPGEAKAHRGPRGFRLKSTKFYVRRSAARFLDRWLDARCGPKDQIALWHAAYAAGRDAGCLRYDVAKLERMTYAEAYHTERPSLNYLFRRCGAFRFACGRQFVLPEMEHEGAFARDEGVAVAYAGGVFRVAPRRDGAVVLDEAYLAHIGLDRLNATARYGAGRPLP